MSDMEYHKGTIKKRFTEKVSFNDGIEILKVEFSIDESDIEAEDERVYCDKVFFLNGEFYIFENHVQFDPDNLNMTTNNEDGSFDVMISFYNGGASLDEVVQDIIDNNKS